MKEQAPSKHVDAGTLGALQGETQWGLETLYERHFCKAISKHTSTEAAIRELKALSTESAALEPGTTPILYRFSWRSRGTVSVMTTVITILLMILTCVLATQLPKDQQARRRARAMHGVKVLGMEKDNPLFSKVPDLSDMPGSGNEFAVSDAPLRLAIMTNFPDPAVHYDASTKMWYTYGTNDEAGILDPRHYHDNISANNTANIQIATSTDFRSWKLYDAASDPLPNAGAWTEQPKRAHEELTANTEVESLPNKTPQVPLSPPFTHSKRAQALDGNDTTHLSPSHGPFPPNVWAPEILKHPTTPKLYIMYYAAAHRDHAPLHCIGTAIASTPLGPFTPTSATALICPMEKGGAIDPAAFVETDAVKNTSQIYLTWKVDGNARGHGGECGNSVAPIVSTPIMIQKLSASGTELATGEGAEAVQILDRTEADGPLVEAPALVTVNGTYFLFYSGGCTRDPDYTLRYATATNVMGPYVRAGGVNGRALLQTGDYGLEAPGSASVKFLPDDGGDSGVVEEGKGRWVLALHARVRTKWGGVRAVFTAGLEFDAEARRVSIVDGL